MIPGYDRYAWANRGMGDYQDVRSQLCINASRKHSKPPAYTKFVTKTIKGLTVTLCRHFCQDGDEFLIPVLRDEAASWNVPLPLLFEEAIHNMPVIFPPAIYDHKQGKFIKDSFKPNRVYDLSGICTEEIAAEDHHFYKTDHPDELFYSVTSSPLINEALLLYPSLLKALGKRMERNPVIISPGPGRIYLYGYRQLGELLAEKIGEQAEKLRDLLPAAYEESHAYKYMIVHNSLVDLTPGNSLDNHKHSNLNIPENSVVSAWGDPVKRARLIELSRIKKKPPASPDKGEDAGVK